MRNMFANFNNQAFIVQDVINDFVSSKDGKQSEKTVKYYRERLKEFNDFLKQEGILHVHEITRAVVDRYMGARKAKNPKISNQTLNSYLRAIRAFVNYCIEEDYMKYFKITMYPKTSIPKKPYTEEEQALLLKKPDMNKCTFADYRNWVIVCHFLASGNRSRTVRYIRIKHVELDRKRIVLDTTKNNEVLYMPISDIYYPIIREYLKIRKGEPEDFLFCNQHGEQLTEGGLRKNMYNYNKGRGVETTSLHRFRNTFAETWIMNDGNPKKLQYALGHKTASMVDEYVSIYGRELSKEFNDYAPLSLQKEMLETKKKIRL